MVITGIFVYLFFEVSIDILLLAPVTAGEGLTIGVVEFVDKALKKIPHRCNGLLSLRIFDLRRPGCVNPVEIAQIYGASEEDPAIRLA